MFRILVISFLLSFTQLSAAETRHALLIGNNDYRPLPKLAKAINDADALGAALTEVGFTSPIVVHNQTKEQILQKFSELKSRVRPGDSVFIFFAGHGVAISGANYWLGVDTPNLTKPSAIIEEGIGFEEIIDPLREAGAKTLIIVSDACRENPFADRNRGYRGVGQARGLARVDQQELKPGVALFFSAGPNELALDFVPNEPKNPNSIYTSTLIKLLKEPGLHHVDIAKELRRQVAAAAKLHVGNDAKPHSQYPDYTDRVDGYLVFRPGTQSPSRNLRKELVRHIEENIRANYSVDYTFDENKNQIVSFSIDKGGTPAFAISYSDTYGCSPFGSVGCISEVYSYDGTFKLIFEASNIVGLNPSNEWFNDIVSLETIEFTVGNYPIFGIYRWNGSSYKLVRLEFCGNVHRQHCSAAEEPGDPTRDAPSKILISNEFGRVETTTKYNLPIQLTQVARLRADCAAF